MKKTTIRWRIFKYNLTMILLLMALITIIFNITVGRYFQRSITGQMDLIADRIVEVALLKGPEFFPPEGPGFLPPEMFPGPLEGQDISPFYFMLDRALREPLSVLDADYLLMDPSGKRITVPQDQFFTVSRPLEEKLLGLVHKGSGTSGSVLFDLEGTPYIAVVKPVSHQNSFGLGWIVLYSSLEKVERIQGAVNMILLGILLFSALVMVMFSSQAAQRVCAPFAQLDRHIQGLAERRFGQQLSYPVDEELQGLVDTINRLSERLDKHDQAQKTFLQNVSHELRTPLMAIQSHGEGIIHQVVPPETAAEVILAETRRLTGLVENLLYLSRLDALEEVYDFNPVELNALALTCVQRFSETAVQAGIRLEVCNSQDPQWVLGDEEKLGRALCNLISNALRYGNKVIQIMIEADGTALATVKVQDDGPGVDPEDLPRIFERFYRGRNGKFGLGLAIVKAVADRHGGTVSVFNSFPGACFCMRLMRQGTLTEERGCHGGM